MAIFSKKVENFFVNVGVDPAKEVVIVPKSDSCAYPGDLLYFRYKLGTGKNSVREYLVLALQPITKDAHTGNKLLTGIKLPEDAKYTPESLDSLYNNKELPKENYRTFILTRIYGPLRKILK